MSKKNKKHYSPKPNFPNKTTSTVPTSTKKKSTRKKLSFWLVVSFLIICGVGSILGSYSFVENRVKADTSVTAFFGANLDIGFCGINGLTSIENWNGDYSTYTTAFKRTTAPISFYNSTPPVIQITAFDSTNSSICSPRFVINPSSNNTFSLYLHNDFSCIYSPNYLSHYFRYQFGDLDTIPSSKFNYFTAYSSFGLNEESLRPFRYDQLGSLNSLLNVDGYYDFSTYFNINTAYKTYFNFYAINFNLVPNYNDIYLETASSFMLSTCFVSTGPITSDIVGVEIGNRSNSFGVDNNYWSGTSYNYITYHCANGNTLTFAFCLGNMSYSEPNTTSLGYISSTNYVLDTRYYSIIGSSSESASYQAGYTSGYNDGLNVSSDTAFKNGEKVGYNRGYQNGYSNGLEDSQNFNFFSLMASVVDAPVQAVSGLLDFNIFGFNMQSVFFGFLTIALVIFVIRKLT